MHLNSKANRRSKKLRINLKALNEAVSLSNEVSVINLRERIEFLAAFPTRHTLSQEINEAADWIIGQFKSFGYSNVDLSPYTRNGFELNNIVCNKKSFVPDARTIIICAHYDSINDADRDNPTAPAPGADDNATGVAAVLEIARILVNTNFSAHLQFVCFSGEEQDCWGSTAYAEYMKQINIDLKFVLNLDEIGCPSKSKEAVIESDNIIHPPTNDHASLILAQSLEQIALSMGIPTMSGYVNDSDYIPFQFLNYVVVGLFESGNYTHAHTPQDTPDKIDYDYLVNVTKIALTAMFI